MTAPGQRLTIAEIGQQILDSIVAQYAASSLSLPDRRYLVAGEPLQVAWDCEQVAVGLQGVGWGQAEDTAVPSPKVAQHFGVAAVRHAVFSVQVVRCTPTGSGTRSGLPSMAAIHEAGTMYMRDAGQLSQALVWLVAHLELGPEGLARAGAITPLGPSGAFHGAEGTLAVTAADLV